MGLVNTGTAIVNNCTITGGSGSGAGGIDNGGTLTVNNSTISGCVDQGHAGRSDTAVGIAYPAGDALGGGIYMGAGTLTINSSTIADNVADGGSVSGTALYQFDGAWGDGFGGGLYLGGGTVVINNSTVADNQADGGLGAFYNASGSGCGGGIYNAVGPDALQMYNTVLADNSVNTVGFDLYGDVTSLGHNLIGSTDCGSGFAASDIVNVDPQLGPLQNNGGPTPTMALLPGSPAVDAGDNTNAPTYDQRGPGFSRIVNGTIDIGAFEVQNGGTNQANSLSVTGFSSPTTAGVAGSFTVTALNADGSTDTGYTGTVHFGSTDGQAGLPADYTFSPTDSGTHSFYAALKTAGPQSITATDIASASITGSETGIMVNPAAASSINVVGFPSPATAGVAGSFSVMLKDTYGNIATGYTGTVHFTSSDGKASLPANYTFTAGDAGKHSFTAILKTAGTQSLTATDTTTAGLAGTDGGIAVNPAAASQFILTAPASISAGKAFSLTLTVEDAYGNVVTGYTGTVHFSSTDTRARLPANYTFTASDRGVHTFGGLVLRTKDYQKITITDMHNDLLVGTVVVDVL